MHIELVAAQAPQASAAFAVVVVGLRKGKLYIGFVYLKGVSLSITLLNIKINYSWKLLFFHDSQYNCK